MLVIDLKEYACYRFERIRLL